MKRAKKVLILILSLVFLFTPVLISTCLATGPPLIKADSSSYFYEGAHPHYHQTTCLNKVTCPDNYHCCNLVIEGIMSYFLGLDSYPVTPVEIFFQPLEITQ